MSRLVTSLFNEYENLDQKAGEIDNLVFNMSQNISTIEKK